MKIFISILLGISLLSCSKIESDVPGCIKKQILKFEKSEGECPSAEVSEYQYQENRYYVFHPGNCGADMAIGYYNEKCESIGSSGGFSGGYEITDPDFSKADFVRVVWESN